MWVVFIEFAFNGNGITFGVQEHVTDCNGFPLKHHCLLSILLKNIAEIRFL